MLYRCLKDKNPALVLGIGQILLFSSILLLASVFGFSHFGVEIKSPFSFLSDEFFQGVLAGFGGVMLGLSLVLNIQGMNRLRKERERSKENE